MKDRNTKAAGKVYSRSQAQETLLELIREIEQEEILHSQPHIVFSVSELTESETLSPRQLEVLQLVAEGHANKEIASELGITKHGVDAHMRKILNKLNANDRAQAVAIAFRCRWID